jgi:hypothetical protein
LSKHIIIWYNIYRVEDDPKEINMSSLNFVKENYPQVLNEIKAELNKGDKIKYAEIVE